MYQLTVTYNNLSDFSLIHLISKGVFVKCAEFVYLCNLSESDLLINVELCAIISIHILAKYCVCRLLNCAKDFP